MKEQKENVSDSRVVLVTGGSTGIGRGIAEAFAKRGERVVIVSRNEERLQAAARVLGPSVSWEKADVSDAEDVRSMVNKVVERFGRIDVLVNCAAPTTYGGRITTTTPFEEAERLWDTELGVGLKGAFLVMMAAAPRLPRPGGRIISVSSIAAFTGGSRPGSMAYAAAKAGILGLTLACARELSSQGITVNAVAPGFIAETGLTGNWPEERKREIIAQTPVGRAGEPKDVAGAVLYLASPEAAFVTGQVLNVNGGWLFRS